MVCAHAVEALVVRSGTSPPPEKRCGPVPVAMRVMLLPRPSGLRGIRRGVHPVQWRFLVRPPSAHPARREPGATLVEAWSPALRRVSPSAADAGTPRDQVPVHSREVVSANVSPERASSADGQIIALPPSRDVDRRADGSARPHVMLAIRSSIRVRKKSALQRSRGRQHRVVFGINAPTQTPAVDAGRPTGSCAARVSKREAVQLSQMFKFGMRRA